jgi:1-acyl-sn-glycerol-3-phosphate acyltransferase
LGNGARFAIYGITQPNYWVAGVVYSSPGGFAIDREHPGTASLRYSIELLQHQQVLVLFPEGYIFSDDQVHPLQSGVARIALKSLENQPELQLHIIPVSIRYQHPAPPPWGCSVWVKMGSALNVRDYLIESTKQAAKTLTADLETALQTLHQPQSSEMK